MTYYPTRKSEIARECERAELRRLDLGLDSTPLLPGIAIPACTCSRRLRQEMGVTRFFGQVHYWACPRYCRHCRTGRSRGQEWFDSSACTRLNEHESYNVRLREEDEPGGDQEC